MNSVERLFEKVLSDIGNTGANVIPKSEWPIPSWEHEERVPPIGSDEDVFDADNYDDPDGILEDVSTEERELIEGNIRSGGLDVLAFYKSPRFKKNKPFKGKWGIFYLKTGLNYLAKKIKSEHPECDIPKELARNFLHKHEFMHYKCDLQVLMLEAVLKRNLYVPLHSALKGQKELFVEEALANRAIWDWSKKKKSRFPQEFAELFMDLQPAAYSRFREDINILRGEWMANVLDLEPPGTRCRRRTDIPQWADAAPSDLIYPGESSCFMKGHCPQYIISPKNITDWLNPALVLPPVNSIVDAASVKKVLKGKYRNLEKKWQKTKNKLKKNRLGNGLNLKPWKKDGKDAYSVKIDYGNRAHLRHMGHGDWMTYTLGNHKDLGHG
jgi:hypothetical protein